MQRVNPILLSRLASEQAAIISTSRARNAEQFTPDAGRVANVGDYKWSARDADFDGWLLCDGRSVSCHTYADLYSVVGDRFGVVVPGSFCLPDARGRVACGASSDSDRGVGSVFGSSSVTLTQAELPAHHHAGTTNLGGSHAHTGTTDGAGLHSHSVPRQTALDGEVKNFGIRGADKGPIQEHEFKTENVPTQLGGDHQHAFSTSANGNHTHSFTSAPAGQGLPFSVDQPSIVIGSLFMYGGVN